MELANLFTGENAITLNTVFSQIYGLIPYVLPAVLGFVGFRKGISFLMGQIHGA